MSNLQSRHSNSPTILHASDLHIGAHMPELINTFRDIANLQAPALVILSGDLTDGGRQSEYDELASYLSTFRCPVFIVPGNHDSPVEDIVGRIIAPFKSFDALLAHRTSFQCAAFEVAELRTAAPIQTRFDWSKGVAPPRNVRKTLGSFSLNPASAAPTSTQPWRIVVGHHPIVDAPEVHVAGDVIGGFDALSACDKFGVDLILSGHTHQTWVGRVENCRTLLATAPTLSSPRIRGEAQGFHAYALSDNDVVCDVWRWVETAFVLEASNVHPRWPHTKAMTEL